MNSSSNELVTTLRGWHREMSNEVRLVFDHADSYRRIIELATELTGGPADLLATAAQQAHYANQLAELSEQLGQMSGQVDRWQGASRQAFDQTIQLLDTRVDELAEIGRQSSELLDTAEQGRQATDQLFSELVRTSIDYAERSLQAARTLAPLTGGLSLSSWTASNLKQVSRLLDQLVDAGREAGSLLNQVSFLIGDLTQTAAQVTDELSRIERTLRS